MSSTRSKYDLCAYRQEIKQSTGPLSYVLDPAPYQRCDKCRMALGIVGGSEVGNIRGSIVDLESDMRGQTRRLSNCPSMQYHNPCNASADAHSCNPSFIPFGNDPDAPPIDVRMVPLPDCQMINYKPVVLPPPMEISSCQSRGSQGDNSADELEPFQARSCMAAAFR